MSKEIIKIINSEIKRIIDEEGKFDETFPPNTYLLDLKKAWEKNNLDEITLIADKAFKSVAQKISRKTTKANEKNILQSQQWISSFAEKLDHDNPIIKYADPIVRTKCGDELSALFKDCTHDQLSALVSQLIIEREIDLARNSLVSSEASHLRKILFEIQDKRITKGQKASKSIEKLHAGDKKALNTLYENLQAELGQPPSFRRFLSKVRSLGIKPNYVKAPRLSPEERRLDERDKAYVINEKEKERNGEFTEPNLRDFYEEKSNQKATTKHKSSSLK